MLSLFKTYSVFTVVSLTILCSGLVSCSSTRKSTTLVGEYKAEDFEILESDGGRIAIARNAHIKLFSDVEIITDYIEINAEDKSFNTNNLRGKFTGNVIQIVVPTDFTLHISADHSESNKNGMILEGNAVVKTPTTEFKSERTKIVIRWI